MDESLDISAIVEVEKTIYCCETCWYTSSDKSNYNKHVKRMHNPAKSANSRPTSTPMKKSTSHTITTTKRANANSGKTKFICESCGMQYSTHYSLDLHIRNKHKLEFKHKCDTCGKGFNQRTQYRFHIASHAKIALDKCRFCKSEFTSHSSLPRHFDVCPAKDNVRPFVCNTCQASFSKKYKLQEHVKGKHGPPTYHCECGRCFNWRSSLKAHSEVCKNKQ